MRTCFRLCGRRVSSPLVLAAVAALAAAEALAAALAAATEVPGATRAARHVGRLRLALTVVVHRVELHLVALHEDLLIRHVVRMDEDVLGPVARGDEAVALDVVEELHSAGAAHGRLGPFVPSLS